MVQTHEAGTRIEKEIRVVGGPFDVTDLMVEQ